MFSTKKVDFIKKITFLIDNDSQYFPSKNHFLYRKNDIQKNFVDKKIFPIVLLRKRQKVPKFYLLVFRQKVENPSLH